MRRPTQSGPRPQGPWPPGPWLRWGWRGLFIRGHVANQFLLFCVVGASGVVVNSLVMWFLYEGAGLVYWMASVGAFAVASVNNFLWNKVFTFQERTRGWAVAGQYFSFLGVSLVGLAINLAVLVLLVELSDLHPVLANLVGILVATVSNFVGNRYITFRRRA